MSDYHEMMDDSNTLMFVLYLLDTVLIRETLERNRLGDVLDQCEDAEYDSVEQEYVDQCEYAYEIKQTVKRVEQMQARLMSALNEV